MDDINFLNTIRTYSMLAIDAWVRERLYSWASPMRLWPVLATTEDCYPCGNGGGNVRESSGNSLLFELNQHWSSSRPKQV